MFEKYSSKKMAAVNLSKVQQKALMQEILKIAEETVGNTFDFSIPLDDDVKERLSRIDSSESNLRTAVEAMAVEGILNFSVGKDFEQNDFYQLAAFRNTGEQLTISFDYFEPLNRLDMMICVELPKQEELIQYNESYVRNRSNVLSSFIKNSFTILQKVDSVIAQYHDEI